MRSFLKICLGLIPIITFAQSNYRTGNINDCYTWGQWAQIYTTLNNISIINGTTINLNKGIKMNSMTFSGTNSVLTLAGSNRIDLSGGTTDVQCGGVYGEDVADGTGKFKYYITTSVDCATPATQANYDISYIYRGYTVTFGPIRRSGTYKWTKFFGVLYNRTGGLGTCTSCWTSDWNFGAAYYLNGASASTAYASSNIWDNRGRLYRSNICSNTYETYENNWSFGNVTLNAGDMVEIRFTTPVKSGTSAASRSCCVDPLHYIKIDVELTEQ